MSKGNILFRVDGSAREGMGRVARCLALANALQRKRHQMTFVANLEGAGWAERIRRFRHAVARTPHAAGGADDAREFLKVVVSQEPIVVVVDSPAYGEADLRALAGRVPVLICLDDDVRRRLPGQLVINPTLGRSRGEYDLDPGTQLVAGARYAMVRAEFRRARQLRATEPGGPPRVLVALGGGDNAKASAALAKALAAKKKFERIEVALGADGDRKALDAVAAASGGKVTVSTDVRDLSVRMSKAHLLISGAGNTALEAACVGMPMLLVARGPHQEINAQQLDEAGAGQYVGRQDRLDAPAIAAAAVAVLEDNFERKAMSRSGRMLIDGRGPDRIVTATELLLRHVARRNRLAFAPPLAAAA